MTGWVEVLLAIGGLALFVVVVFLVAGAAAGPFRRDRPPRRPRRRQRD